MRALGKHNPLVKQLARLTSAADRREQGRFLVEGVRVLEEARSAGVALESLLYDPARAELPRHRALIDHWSEVAWEAPAELMEKLSPAETSQGLLGVAPLPRTVSAALTSSFVLVLDGIRDPGNLGTILRTAWASQVPEIALFECTDPYGPKAVRASAGGLFHVKLGTASLDELERAGLELVALTPRGGHDLFTWEWPQRAAWVLGGEANGQELARLQRAPHRVTIPMSAGCESLNVAATGAILMFERRRRYM